MQALPNPMLVLGFGRIGRLVELTRTHYRLTRRQAFFEIADDHLGLLALFSAENISRRIGSRKILHGAQPHTVGYVGANEAYSLCFWLYSTEKIYVVFKLPFGSFYFQYFTSFFFIPCSLEAGIVLQGSDD